VGSAEVGDEVLEQGGERLGGFLVRGVSGVADQLDGTAPQARDGELAAGQNPPW
jgi:hypothetical protein